MHLSCKHCGEQIEADDMSLDTAIAKCRGCNAVFSFAQELGIENRKTRPEVEMPKGITIDRLRSRRLKMIRRWFSAGYLGLLFFCVIWNGFLVVWYFIAFSEDTPLMMKVFPIVHVAVGIGLAYATFAGLVNKTVIEFVGRDLVIRHGPVPWPGNRRIRSGDLTQLYCEHKVTYGKHGRQHHRYQLNAVLTDGKKVKLLSGLQEVEQALFLEQEIERYLEIADEAVEGEMGR